MMRTLLLICLFLPSLARATTRLTAQDLATPLSVSGGVTANSGLYLSSTVAPTVACNAGTALPNAISTNQHGRFTAGAAAANCTVTFSAAWPKTPSCFCNDETSIVVVRAVSTTTTLVCSVAVTMGGDVINYFCAGAP